MGTNLKDYVQTYQSKSLAQSPSTINSISDMKRFVEEYPEFKKLGGNVSKHVALVGELSRIVGRDKLLEVGEVEQGLATSAGADFRVCQDSSFPPRTSCCLSRVSPHLSQIAPYLRGTSFVWSYCMRFATRNRKQPTLRLSSIYC